MISVENYANEARRHVGRHQVGCFQFNVQYIKAFSEQTSCNVSYAQWLLGPGALEELYGTRNVISCEHKGE